MPGRKHAKNIIASRLKALLSVADLFSRGDSPSLGKINSAPWTNIRGSWGISSGKATSSDSPSSYPLSTLTFSKTDVTVSVDGITPGMGTAFWVTDSGNWWGTYVDATESCQTCSTPGNCSSYFSCCQGNMNTSNPFSYPCCVGNTNEGTVVNGTNQPTCNNGFTATCPCGTYNAGNVAGYSVYYDCLPNGIPYGGAGGNAAPASSCGGCSTGNRCRRFSEPYYNQGSCTCPSSSCIGGYTPGNPYSQFVAGNCNQNGNCIGYNGSNCNSNYAANCCGAYNATTYYSCNCVTTNSIKLIKSIAGSVSTVTTFLLTGTVAGFKTILNGSSVTVSAYSGSGYTSQIGSDQSTTVSGYSKTKKHGILKAPVTYTAAQGSTVEEFRAL
jgi:hypothetical protein